MSSDYRGTNMSAIADAHRKAHAADTQNDIAPNCSGCGSRDTPIQKLKLCSRCQGVQYCSKECQVEHWKEEHRKVCKKMAKEREAQEEAKKKMQESDTQKRIFALADEYPDDLPGQAKAFIDILSNGSDVTAIACANRISDDLELLNECHKQGDLFYPVLASMLEQDLKAIQCQPSPGTALALPSWFMATGILRCFPGEVGFRKPRTAGGISSYNEERCVAYFGTCWKAFLDFSVGLWNATRQDSPDLYEVCKSFWRQLPVCLVHEGVARAIFESTPSSDDSVSFSDAQSPLLKPLLTMLNLHNMADDLEGLTNQVAALLVIHARNMNDTNVISSTELERSITKRMDRVAKKQWRELSLVVAKAMVDKKRQLSNDEFRRIVQRIYR